MNGRTLATWADLLRSGRRVLAVGGSDAHAGRPGGDWNRLGFPLAWVRSEATTAGVVTGLRAGRVVLTEGPGTWLELTAERDGARFQVGDSVPPGGPVRVHCRARGAAGDLVLLGRDGELARRRVGSEGPAGIATDLDLAACGLVRAELWREGDPDGFPLAALANPIWAG